MNDLSNVPGSRAAVLAPLVAAMLCAVALAGVAILHEDNDVPATGGSQLLAVSWYDNENAFTISADSALNGKVCGAQVTTIDDCPGVDIHIRVRGEAGTTDSVLAFDDFNSIPHDDIESMQVLKCSANDIHPEKDADKPFLLPVEDIFS